MFKVWAVLLLAVILAGCTTMQGGRDILEATAEAAKEMSSSELQSLAVKTKTLDLMVKVGAGCTLVGIIMLAIPGTRHLGFWLAVPGFAVTVLSYTFVEYAKWFALFFAYGLNNWVLLNIGRVSPQPDVTVSKMVNKLFKK